MRRLGTAIAVVALALASFGVGAAAAYIEPYTGPGEWFAAGQGRSSAYDGCIYWTGNNFAKGSNAWGLVTFITPSGAWRYSVQKYGNIFRALPEYFWRKKLHCKNNSGSGYQGGCWGDREDGPISCA
jgi:hypothetical protein